ncbi:MAG: type I-U CRISPR-associated protein Cas5/Cas6 [Methanotrichaceae archaeon]|nr:type I-U CRISPR-associated protein Cas5/Cas6 [Methanotrichaceae archaeon]
MLQQGWKAPPIEEQSGLAHQEASSLKDDIPTVARYALAGGCGASLTSALAFAESAHQALVRLSDGSSVFTGCDSLGRPLEGHGHAYILCEADDALGEAGEIAHVTIFARAGFGEREQEALRGLREVWGPDGRGVFVRLLGLGRPEDNGCLEQGKGRSPLLARSRTWISHTPFISTRHAKVTRAGAKKLDSRGRWIGSPEHELWRLLDLSGFPEPETVEDVSCARIGGKDVPWGSFVVRREGGGGRRGSGSCGFRLVFSEAVEGPIALGYAAHYGMGAFRAEG